MPRETPDNVSISKPKCNPTSHCLLNLASSALRVSSIFNSSNLIDESTVISDQLIKYNLSDARVSPVYNHLNPLVDNIF